MNRVKMLLTLLLASIIMLPSCTQQPLPVATDEVTLQLKWSHQAQFAGFYMAQEKGYYAQENLKVKFLEGGQDVDIVRRVISGQADFGVLTPEIIIKERSKGEPLTAIAAIYRRSAVVFVAKNDSDILRPGDFLKKKVAAAGEGGAEEFALRFRAMMKRLGLDISMVEIVPYDPAYTAFYDGEVHVTPCYVTGGLIKMRKKGLRLNLIRPDDYGIRFYSDTLATTEKIIAERPELITRFLRASLKGWQEAVEDYQKAVEITLKYTRTKDAELQNAMMEAMLPLVHTGEDYLGWMTPEMWKSMVEVMFEQGLLARPLDSGEPYNLRFLKEVYRVGSQ